MQDFLEKKKAGAVKLIAQSQGFDPNFGGYDEDYFPISNSILVEMESEKKNIKVWCNGTLCIDFDEATQCTKGTASVAGCYPGHTGIESAEFTVGGVTPLIDAVRAPSYQNKSNRFIVDFCDSPREDFNDLEKVGELSERIKADEAYYIGAGTSVSKASIQQFIQRCGGNGTYVQNTRPDIYQQIADYIYPIVNKREPSAGKEYLIKDKQYAYEVES